MRASLVLRQQHSQAARLGAFQAGRIGQRRSERSACRPQAFLSFFRKKEPRPPPPRTAADDLVEAIEGSQRGLIAEKSAAIEAAVAELERLIGGGGTTGSAQLSGTWRLLWTTEKETLFILKNASWFGTQAGEVYQVIDVPSSTLQNVILFPPEGAFIVDATISTEGPQRTQFQFSSATLKLPNRSLKLPPFGKGWFDTVYVDEKIRVAKDSRGDTLVVARDGAPRQF